MMITSIALLMLSADPAGFNPHLAQCWSDPNCYRRHMSGRMNGLGSSSPRDQSPDVPGPLCSGDLETDRRCIDTPRADLGEGIELFGGSESFNCPETPDSCGPGDKFWPHCVRTDPSVYFPPMRNGYLGHLVADFREQLRSELLRPDEPPVQILDDHTFLIRRDQLAYFAVLWRLCPSCVEVRDGLHNMRQGIRGNPSAPLSVEGWGLQADQGVLSELRSDALLLTWHRPHNWRQYAPRRQIRDLLPVAGSGDTPENRETIAGLVLSPHDLRYEYARPVHGLSELRAEQDMGGLEQSSGRDSVSLSPLQRLVRQRSHCTQYCGDRTPAEMQYDLGARTATSGTRPGVVEPVVASSLAAALLNIPAVVEDCRDASILAAEAVNRSLRINAPINWLEYPCGDSIYAGLLMQRSLGN